MTNIKNTFHVLNEQYTDYNGKFNQAALDDILSIEIYNNKKYIEEIRTNNRRKVEGIVFYAFLESVNGLLEWYEMPTTEATSEQIKKWFVSVGTDYKTALANVVKEMKEERQENN